MRRHIKSILLVTVVAAAATAGCIATASADGGTDQPPSVVEDFSYPGATQILGDTGVKLVSGDGHVLFASCPNGPDTVGLIQVRSSDLIGTNHDGKICFHVLGGTGWLTMQIPNVFSIRGDGLQPGQGHRLKAKLTTSAGAESTVDVSPSGTTQVGIATTPPGDPTTLLRLDASS
ncbi:hypothetical protein [Amycolatopsis sp. cmx-4-61]|uniref:hypothetical protein n=1 Tax=Amycolatopsis sp. cmx-4-61 TaxID=2790937 RepID=UPI0039792709